MKKFTALVVLFILIAVSLNVPSFGTEAAKNSNHGKNEAKKDLPKDNGKPSENTEGKEGFEDKKAPEKENSDGKINDKQNKEDKKDGENTNKKEDEKKEFMNKEEREQRRIENALDNLSTQNYIPFEASVYFFERMGENAVSYLVKHLKDHKDDVVVRNNVIYVFGRLGPKAANAVPYITPFLKDENPDTRSVAAIALGKIGEKAKDAVPMLGQLQYDQEKWVSKSANEALKRIGTERAISTASEFENKNGKGN